MEPIIRVDHLVQKMGRKTFLNDLSFEVMPGECFGVFGTRGTGKTTLVHILAGVDRFTSGEVEILGTNIRKSEKYKRDLGLLTQERSLFLDMSVYENLDFIAALKNAPRKNIEEMIERFELRELLKEPITVLDTIGTYQRLALACALVNQPKLLIVDEVIKDIDLYSRRLIIKELKQYLADGGTLVCAFSNIAMSHYMTRVGWLENMKMIIYTSETALAEWKKQEELYTE
ncbi:ABC transporter ATP-binding protein [Desulfitobacterium sp.]|uniref:ABC transporter ATP-binding protein n=1 Tax=Desulfitobacterium sp. TaxID=49981 RepID=UPI002B20BFB0|nr:ABC transporter ATP-binding protein [Desulfitobacterium sp.]MEA4900376.1 ABC transporter ATP-binding protein [Desulfitobacterium sp.]